MPYDNGPTIATPQIVNITYDADPFQADLDAWAQWVLTSDWLSAVGNEYGIGTSQAPVQDIHLSDTPPSSTTDTQIQLWLAQQIEDSSSPVPSPTPNTIYFIYYPVGTTVTNLFGQTSCQSFLGYHNAFTFLTQGGFVTYAVVSDCGPGQTDANLDELHTLEVVASHELMEAASDPNLVASPGYRITDPTNPWYSLDGELGDMCEFLQTYYSQTDSSGNVYEAQRIWSNNAATQDTTSPCVPLPELPLPFFNESAGTQSQLANPGDTVTVTLSPWSTGPVSPWTPFTYNEGTVNGAVSQTFTTLQNGQQNAQLSITVDPSASTGDYVVIMVQQPAPATGDTLFWPITIGVQ